MQPLLPMRGYDADEAEILFVRRLSPEYAGLSKDLPGLTRAAIRADIAFMHETGVLREDGSPGPNRYQEDLAILALTDALQPLVGRGTSVPLLIRFISDFLDLQDEYLAFCGLVPDE